MPIVPGTRVTEAEAQPPTSPRPVIALHEQMPPTSPSVVALSGPVRSQSITVTGLISATEERAEADARRKLASEVINWLEPEVPGSWTPPPRMLDTMVLETRIKPVDKDYGTLYEASSGSIFAPAPRPTDRGLQPRTGRAAADNLGGTLAFISDLPGRCFRLHPRRRGDQGLLHQPAEDAGRRRRRCSGRASSTRWWRDTSGEFIRW